MNNAVNILREGSMMKALTKLGIPIVIAMLIMAIYNVVDTFLGLHVLELFLSPLYLLFSLYRCYFLG